jgi:hypothetical protein
VCVLSTLVLFLYFVMLSPSIKTSGWGAPWGASLLVLGGLIKGPQAVLDQHHKYTTHNQTEQQGCAIFSTKTLTTAEEKDNTLMFALCFQHICLQAGTQDECFYLQVKSTAGVRTERHGLLDTLRVDGLPDLEHRPHGPHRMAGSVKPFGPRSSSFIFLPLGEEEAQCKGRF